MAASRALSLGRFLGPAAEAAAGAPFQAALEYSTVGGVAAYKLPDLPYAYSALEPILSAQIMELHHAKHHAAYVANLNKALEEYADAEAKRDLQKMIALQGAINFNGGGALLSAGRAAGVFCARACARAAAANKWFRRAVGGGCWARGAFAIVARSHSRAPTTTTPPKPTKKATSTTTSFGPTSRRSRTAARPAASSRPRSTPRLGPPTP